MKKIAFLFILPALLLQFWSPVLLIPAVQAANPLDISEQEGFQNSEIPSAFGQSDTPLDIRIIIANIIRIVLTFLGIIFLGLLVYAGFKWMTAAGNSDQVDEAKKQITVAVIGLAVILSSYAIMIFIMKMLVKAVDNYSYWP